MLDDFCAVPNVNQVRMDSLDHRRAGVPEFPADRVDRYRCAVVEGLQTGRAVGVPEPHGP